MARDGTCPGSDTYKSPGSFCCPSRQACSTHAASGCSFSTNGSYESCGHAQCAQLAKLAKQVLLHLHICGCTLLRQIKPRKLIGIDFLLWLVATEGISCAENKLDRPSQESPSSKGMLRTLLVAVELALRSHDITKLTQLIIILQHGHHGENPRGVGHICICGRTMRHPKNPRNSMSIHCLLWLATEQA